MYVEAVSQESGQAAMIWVLWMLLDIPVSMLAYELSEFSPFAIHAIAGSLWWYFLTLIFVPLRKRSLSPTSGSTGADGA
jgi:peptidoglycan biosynthesis protein MviN/MurJ (putative lipid II flippase)